MLQALRRCSHYGRNDGDGTVTFCRSHFTFCNVAVAVSLPCRHRRRGKGSHGDGHGDGSRRCYFSCVRTKKQTMASKGKRTRAKWDSEVERKLIDIWADILEEFDGKIITRKKKEGIATTRLNVYVSQELNRAEQYTEKEVCNKIDTIMKKGKGMYVSYQKKGETGKEYTQDEADFDLEAAKTSWPNFKTFYQRFKDHPALGPGSVEDTAATPSPTVAREEVVEQEGELGDTPSSSRCPSRQSNKSIGGDTDSEEDDDEIPVPAKKPKEGETPLVARVGKKKGKQTGATQFLVAFGELQEQTQVKQQQHERRMQQEAMSFQQKMEQDRIKFEAQLATSLQQQSSQFQSSLMQQNQLFQAELFKKLFEKKDS